MTFYLVVNRHFYELLVTSCSALSVLMFSLAGRSLARLDPSVHCSVSASAAHVSQAAMTPVRAVHGCRIPQPCAAMRV